MSASKSRAIDDFVERVLHHGFAVAPKAQIASWYDQTKFSKGIIADLKARAEDQDNFGPFAAECRIFQTPNFQILMTCDMTEWTGE
jgi:hypothetical protein